MKKIGLALLVLAAVLLLYSCAMDVTVPLESGGRVVNFHLLSQRSSAQNFGFLAGVVGVLLYVFGKKNEKPIVYNKATRKLQEGPVTKKCPFCAEEILLDAIKCKHCQSDLSEQSA